MATLPDGRKIRISNEKFEAPEILFNPYLCQSEQCGIHEMVYNSINVSFLIYLFYRHVQEIQEKIYIKI